MEFGASAVLAIPEALKALVELYDRFADASGKQKASMEIERLKTGVHAYLETQEALRDWKELHEGLHELRRSLPVMLGSPSSSDAYSSAAPMRPSWMLIRMSVVDKYFSSSKSYDKIPQKFKVETVTQGIREIDWKNEVINQSNDISKLFESSFTNVRQIRTRVEDFVPNVDQILSEANRQLITVANDLVEMSQLLANQLQRTAPSITTRVGEDKMSLPGKDRASLHPGS